MGHVIVFQRELGKVMRSLKIYDANGERSENYSHNTKTAASGVLGGVLRGFNNSNINLIL